MGERRRRPLPMKHVGTDPAVVLGHQLAGPPVEHDQRGGLRQHNFAVIHSVGRAGIHKIAMHQHGRIGRVVRKDRQIAEHVEPPEDVGIGRPQLQRRRSLGHGEVGFVAERAVVAIGQAVEIEAKHLAAIGHEIDPVVFDSRRRADAQVHVVEILAHLGAIDLELGHDQPPEQLAGPLVQAEQHAAPSGPQARVVQILVVGADQHPAGGNHGGGIVLAPEPRDPVDVFHRRRVDAQTISAPLAGLEPGRQPGLGRGHRPLVAAAPLGPIGRAGLAHCPAEKKNRRQGAGPVKKNALHRSILCDAKN